ncbi:MAG TPA: HEAT repeat domain-containing protein, partial [Kofleriaceae bacterium]|nr:HEAT repeat domain-containing protein [Kofleriaceae bacterium]
AGSSDGIPARAVEDEAPAAHGLAARVALLDEDERPLGRTTALHLIEVADDRDRVFYALLRALRSRTRWAGVLVVQGGAAVGRVALADLGIDTSSITNISIPLDRPSPFHAVIMGRHPYVGHVTSGDPAIDDMVMRMGGTIPTAALLLPIVLRDRCVALAVAHRGAVPITLADVSDLLPLAPVAAQALGRILLSRKREQPASVPPPAGDPLSPRSPRAATLVPPVTRGGTVSAGVVTPVRRGRDITATAPVIRAPALRPLAQVLAELDAADPDVAEAALVEAAHRADEVLPLLPSRFPGTLRIDRYAAGGRTLLPGQYGPMLDLAVRLGARAADPLVDLLGDDDRDVRFYAAICLGALRARSALHALVERVFDTDYGVRNVALEALATFSPRDIDAAMAGVRPALHSEDLERVQAVAHAVTVLVDVGALGDLVDLVGKDAKRAEIARRALIALTRHDMGTSARRWRSWFDEHRGRHRIEWLIDALGHRDQPLREAALEDLRRLTGEDFGGVGDENRKEREALTERWRAWWSKTGRRRFVA